MASAPVHDPGARGHRFDTAIGPCAIAWRADGALLAVRILPGPKGPLAGEPPPPLRRLVARIQALLRGERVGFDDDDDLVLAWDTVPAFHRRVYEVALRIRAGQTLTYGEVAARVGDAGAARAVGHALGRNPWPIVVPCHRVLAAAGRLGGFSAPGGADTKLRLLEIEGAWPGGQPSLFER